MIPNKVRNTDDLFTVWFQSVLLAKTQKKHCTKKLSFSIKDSFSKCDQIRRKLSKGKSLGLILNLCAMKYQCLFSTSISDYLQSILTSVNS